MNDTTRWIMIILLLLLIAAAVFMLLRSPGKDNGDAAVGRADADRDGVPDAQEDRIEPAGGTAARGVYDQEADARAAAAGDTRAQHLADEPTAVEDRGTLPAGDRMDEYAHPDAVDDTARQDRSGATAVELPHEHTPPAVDERPGYEAAEAHPAAEPYRPEAGAVEDGRGTADVHPLTDDEIAEAGREEPLTRQEQEPVTSPEGSAVADSDPYLATDRQGAVDRDRRGGVGVDGPDGAPAAAGAAGAAGATGATAVTAPGDRAQEHPVGDESTAYRAADADAVVVGVDQPSDTRNWTDTHAGPDTAMDADAAADTGTTAGGADTAYAGWDTPPADTGTGAPPTADEILGGHTEVDTTDTRDAGGTTTDESLYAPVYTEAAYGAGSAEPLEDGSGPAGWEVKGNIGSMLFHTPESPSYDAVRAEVWFESEDAARAAGFAHWDRRRR